MATFYGSLEGEKKIKTKMGQRRIACHLRSWDHGIKVQYFMDDKDNAYCVIYETGGSNDPKEKKMLKTYKLGKVSNRRPGSAYAGGVGN